MKTIYLKAVFLLLMFVSLGARSQTWSPLGTASFSPDSCSYSHMAIAPDNTPYIVFQDNADSNKVSVMKYNGSSWAYLGSSGFSDGFAEWTDLAISYSGTPYVVYTESFGTDTSKTSVKKFDGTNWVNVGSPRFSPPRAGYTRIATDAAGTPYVVFANTSNWLKTNVMKYDGAGWVYVGSPDFSAGAANYTSIAIDTGGTPYVAYQDYGYGAKATVMKFDGASWVNVGVPGFTDSFADQPDLTISNKGVPYVIYEDNTSDLKITVQKFDGTTWVPVGSPSFSSFGQCLSPSIKIDTAGTPYIAYWEWYGCQKAKVQRFNGSTWVNVGDSCFSDGEPSCLSLVLTSNGEPYVGYEDSLNHHRTTVMKLSAATTSVNQLSISAAEASKVLLFPNPNNGTFSYKFISDADCQLELVASDVTGRVIYMQAVHAKTGSNTVSVELPENFPKPSIVNITLQNNETKFRSIKMTVTQ